MCFGLGRGGLVRPPYFGNAVSARRPRDLPVLLVMFESLAVCVFRVRLECPSWSARIFA